MTKPFRFGVFAGQMSTRAAWVAQAQRVEELGYSTLLLRDHLAPDYFGHQFAPLIGCMAAADATTTLRIGTMVIDNDFRHPALLAKEVATLDLLSGGRFELGIGAGWLTSEYKQAGIQFDPPGTRIDRLIEAVRVIKDFWNEEAVTFAGDHYRIDGLSGYPLPAQRPHPPILIGGGSRRILRFAGREADIVGVLNSSVSAGVLSTGPIERYSARIAEKVSWVREGAGDRFQDIELSLIPTIEITDDRRASTEIFIREQGWSEVSVDDVWDMPSMLIGTPTEIADQLKLWRERLGFSYIAVGDGDMEKFAPVVTSLAGT